MFSAILSPTINSCPIIEGVLPICSIIHRMRIKLVFIYIFNIDNLLIIVVLFYVVFACA